jgi:hypothetical protein
MSKKVCKKQHTFIILTSFLHYGLPPNLFSKLVCRELKKVENHCCTNLNALMFPLWNKEKYIVEVQSCKLIVVKIYHCNFIFSLTDLPLLVSKSLEVQMSKDFSLTYLELIFT